MYIIKGIAIIILILACCVFVGKLWKRQGNLLEASLLGFATLLAIFQLISMPLGLAGQPFHVACNLFLGVLIALVGLSVVLMVMRRRRYTLHAYPPKIHLLLLTALALIVWQILRQVIWQPIVYGDDSVYIALVNDIRISDVIQGRVPRSGADLALSDTNLKYLFSCYYQFLAFWCRLFDFHPLLLMKTFLPILAGLLSYSVFWLLGEFFFRDNIAKKSFFLFFIALLVEFGNLANHSFSRRMLIWTWNSKTILFTILLPLLFLLANRFTQNQDTVLDGSEGIRSFHLREGLLLATVSVACGAATLTGLAFSVIMLFAVGLTKGILTRRFSAFWKPLLSAVPTLLILFVVILFWKGALHV